MNRKLAQLVAEQERADAAADARRCREITLIDFIAVLAALALLVFVCWVICVSI